MHRWLLLSLLIAGLVLLGLGAVRGEIVALALPLLVYAGAALLGRPEAPKLEATRLFSAERVARGTPVTVSVSIANLGARPATVRLEDQVPPQLMLVEGQTRLLTRLAPGASAELEYIVVGERGVYQFPGVQASVEDPLGLFRATALFHSTGQLFIVPEVSRLRRVEIRPRRTHVYAGQIPARQGGAGVEFYGLREYQPGDPTRWINSRATARNPQTVFVNQFEQERVADVGLILDARQQSDVRTREGALFEYSIQAAAALADTFLHRGNRVGLLMYGRSLDWTLPGYGKLQRERILRALARAQTGDLPVLEKLDYLPTRLFPARSQLVLISPLQAHDADMLAGLRARGYQLLVISPDPVSFELRGLGEQAMAEAAARIARLERALLLQRCRRTGVTVVDWPTDVPFQQIAGTALSRPPIGLHGMAGAP
ncbi:MAG TPA: DUF58 domain-containing protein [Roseiflexaceae bacterium]|nr:DUF58 domain-containing protein [Roseiflexaceae bacterium]